MDIEKTVSELKSCITKIKDYCKSVEYDVDKNVCRNCVFGKNPCGCSIMDLLISVCSTAPDDWEV